MTNKIFVALSTFSEYGDLPLTMIKESGIEYDLNPLKRRLVKKEILDMSRDATGIIAGVEPYDASVLGNLSNLKCISRAGVGVDNIDLNFAKKNNIMIRNTPDVVIRPVVELTLAMIFDLLRKTTFHTLLLKNKRWEKSAGNMLINKKVGIVGTGRIGKATAELLVKLGAQVITYDISPDKKWSNNKGIKYLSFKELLFSADIISFHASPTPDQLPLIGKKEMMFLKKGSIIINTSRGNCIDEEELIKGLKNGNIAAAGIDVFSKEPYYGELTQLYNVVLTPHIATLTKESRLEMETEATKNLLNALQEIQ